MSGRHQFPSARASAAAAPCCRAVQTYGLAGLAQICMQMPVSGRPQLLVPGQSWSRSGRTTMAATQVSIHVAGQAGDARGWRKGVQHLLGLPQLQDRQQGAGAGPWAAAAVGRRAGWASSGCGPDFVGTPGRPANTPDQQQSCRKQGSRVCSFLPPQVDVQVLRAASSQVGKVC